MRASLRDARIEGSPSVSSAVSSSILLFDWDHPSVPTCTRCLPSRAAAVKDEPLFAATASAARSVLDGREHGGMVCACQGRAVLWESVLLGFAIAGRPGLEQLRPDLKTDLFGMVADVIGSCLSGVR